MGKKKRRMTSPKYAKKCALKRTTVDKHRGLGSVAPTDQENVQAEEEPAPQTIQVVEVKKEITPEPVLEIVVEPTIEKKTEPVKKKPTIAKKTQKFAKKKPTAKKRSTKAKSTRTIKKASTKE